MKKLLIIAAFLLLPSAALASQPIMWGTIYGSPHTTTTNVTPASTGNNTGGMVIPIDGTITGMHAAVTAAPGGSVAWRATLQDAGANTTESCNIIGAATSCDNATTTITITKGHHYSINYVPSGGTPTGANFEGWFTFNPTTSGQTIWYSQTSGAYSATAYSYYALGSTGFAAAAEATSTAYPFPEGGTLFNLYADISNSPSPGNVTFWLRDFSLLSTSTPTCNIPTITCNDTTDTYTVPINHLMDFSIVPASSPTARVSGDMAMGFSPTAATDFFITGVTGSAAIGGGVRYFPMVEGQSAQVTESPAQFIVPAMTLTGMYITANTTSTAGKNWVITLRDGAADTAVTCTVNGGTTNNQQCQWTGTFNTSAGDLVDVSATPSGSPNNTTLDITFQGSTAVAGGGATPVGSFWVWFLQLLSSL